MIPKVVHYCWFGKGEKPRLAEKCIASWHQYCPDYQIIEWNEDNFPISQYPYAQYCQENGKWAYLSDFVRLQVVYEYGGIYFDTDVELVKSPSFLFDYQAFFGFENDFNVATGLGFGAEAGHPTVDAMRQFYLDRKLQPDGSMQMIGCPELNTKALLPLGLQLNGKEQMVAGAKILPADFLNPFDDHTGRLKKTENTVSIHWYSKSALSKGAILRSKITRPFHRVFGDKCFDWLKNNTVNKESE